MNHELVQIRFPGRMFHCTFDSVRNIMMAAAQTGGKHMQAVARAGKFAQLQAVTQAVVMVILYLHFPAQATGSERGFSRSRTSASHNSSMREQFRRTLRVSDVVSWMWE